MAFPYSASATSVGLGAFLSLLSSGIEKSNIKDAYNIRRARELQNIARKETEEMQALNTLHNNKAISYGFRGVLEDNIGAYATEVNKNTSKLSSNQDYRRSSLESSMETAEQAALSGSNLNLLNRGIDNATKFISSFSNSRNIENARIANSDTYKELHDLIDENIEATNNINKNNLFYFKPKDL